jgi:DNA-binding transcriptional regulator YdaS (Cro superfamily)
MSKTFYTIFRQFGSQSNLAHELRIKPATLTQWKVRNSVPPKHWANILRVARKLEVNVTAGDLIEAASNQDSA